MAPAYHCWPHDCGLLCQDASRGLQLGWPAPGAGRGTGAAQRRHFAWIISVILNTKNMTKTGIVTPYDGLLHSRVSRR